MNDPAISHQLGVSVATVYLLQFLKRSPWFPWLHQTSDSVTKVVSAAVAVLTSAGFAFAVSGDIHTGGTLTIAFPSLSQLVEVAMHSLTQFGMQQALYHGAVKKPQPTEAEKP